MAAAPGGVKRANAAPTAAGRTRAPRALAHERERHDRTDGSFPRRRPLHHTAGDQRHRGDGARGDGDHPAADAQHAEQRQRPGGGFPGGTRWSRRWASRSSFDLLGLYRGVSLLEKSSSDSASLPDTVHLFRRPILDYWAESGEDLREVVAHVIIHEIGHHFGFSDEEMERIEEGRPPRG
ncbi:MAG: metallopeptidase family protein [Rhodovibrio sp.]|nr:metallopeptidase family protein [Rhodovibrio sp.]